MTIREAIKTYEEIKAKYLKIDYTYAVNNTSLCVIVPLNNGIKLFIDTHHGMDFIREKYPSDLPNKNGVFKRVTFEIIHNGVKPVIPDSLVKYTHFNGFDGEFSHFIDSAKERPINEFINLNGGINEEHYKKCVTELFGG